MNHLDAEKLRQSPADTSAPVRRPAPTPSRAVADYLDLATRPNTRRSYAAALRHFEIEWGGLLPATAEGVINYLAAYGGALSLASLRLHLSALSRWHRDQGFTDPTKAPQVRQVLRGIGTAHPQPSRQARPLPIEEVQRINHWFQVQIEAAGNSPDRLRLLRDRCFLLLGFWRGFRGDELASLRIEHVEVSPGQGMLCYVPRSKGDRLQTGRLFSTPALSRPIGIYTTVLDQWPIVYHQPIVLGERQAGAAIEGVVRQLDIEIERLAVDTHGYTDIALAIARLLGFDLCPRIKNLRERRLAVPRGMAVPEVLLAVTEANLKPQRVEESWDELVRIAASINNGTTSAVLALERYGSAAAGDRVYEAGRTLGRLVRTLHQCDYMTKPPFRRELHRLLNRGETIHTLQRAIHFGEMPHARGRHKDEMLTISGALSLLTNLVIAWNTLKIQEAVTRLEARGQALAPEVVRHIGPARHAHLNFRGTFEFGLEPYRGRLFGTAGDLVEAKSPNAATGGGKVVRLPERR